MPTTQSLLEKRANVWSQMTSILDTAEEAGRELTAEERASYDKAESDLDGLTADIERLERHAQRGDLNAPAVIPDTPEARTAEVDPAEEYRSAFEAWMRTPSGEQPNMTKRQAELLREQRAQSVGTTTAGGYLVPQGFRAQVVETMKDYGAVREVAQVITTPTGANLPWPTNNDTGNVGALLAENTQDSEQDVVLGQRTLDAYKYTSKIVRVSVEFLQDVDWIDAEGFLGRRFAERLGRITNQHFTTGTGTAQPDGIVTSAVNGKTAAGVAAITADELIDLQHSVDRAYRFSPRAAWMMSDTALASIRKLKDSDGQYLWQPNVQTGVAPTLLGNRVVINTDMAVPATGVKSVLFGDFFAGYVIREVRGIEMIRMNERYGDYFQVGFVSFLRTDGTAQDTAAYKALTQA